MFDMFKQFFGDGDDYFGRRVDVPQLMELGDILGTVNAANIRALPQARDLATGINAFNQDATLKLLERLTPGFSEGLKRSSSNAYSLIRGELPEDVTNSIFRSGAARGLGGGYAGTPFARNAVLRDLGLTSLHAQASGAEQMASNAGLVSSLFPQFNVSSALASPAMGLDWAYSKFQRDLLEAKAQAGPDPAARGRAEQEMALFGMVASMFGGGSYTPTPATQQQPLGNAPMGGSGSYQWGSAGEVSNTPYNWGGQSGNTGGGMNIGSMAGMAGGGMSAGQMSGLMSGVGGFAAFCWVAREIYGTQDGTWLKFRQIILQHAPQWVVQAYATGGERFADWLRENESAKAHVKIIMDSILRKYATS